MRRNGFTLIEVIVAVTIAAAVVVAAHSIFAGVVDGAKEIVEARTELDRSANARRWLKAAFLSLEPPFDGRTDRVSFKSWQLAPGGWFEPQSIFVRQNGPTFAGAIGNEQLQLAYGVSSVAFDYLLEPGADAKWVREWISPVSAPLAIRVRVAGCGKGDVGCVDTLLFLVRERG